jgi:hypothetical protein
MGRCRVQSVALVVMLGVTAAWFVLAPPVPSPTRPDPAAAAATGAPRAPAVSTASTPSDASGQFPLLPEGAHGAASPAEHRRVVLPPGAASLPREACSKGMADVTDETRYVSHLPAGAAYGVAGATSAAGRRLRLAIAILSAENLIESRLIPLLETSLRDEHCFVLLQRGKAGVAAAAARVAAYAAETGRNVSVIQLEPLADMRMSLRNAWTDLPGLRELHGRVPGAEWYGIVDDDTYLFTAGVRHLLGNYSARMAEPLYVGDTLRWGEGGSKRSKRIPVSFACGGGGFFMNAATVRKALPFIDRCVVKHMHPAGDVRLGACLTVDVGIPLIRRREFVKDTPFRAVGELRLPNQFEAPVSFHRLRRPSHYVTMRRIETRLGRWGVPQWDDVRRGLPIAGELVRSMFFPKDYANFSVIYGIRPTKKPVKGQGPRCNPQADEW